MGAIDVSFAFTFKDQVCKTGGLIEMGSFESSLEFSFAVGGAGLLCFGDYSVHVVVIVIEQGLVELEEVAPGF